MDHDRIAATTIHPTTRANAEDRFTHGLVFDVLKVLEDHGYGQLNGPQTVDLMLHLLHFLHGESDRCHGRTRPRLVLDDVAEHQAEIDRKVEVLRASETTTAAAMARYDEQEARRHGGR